MKKTGEMLKNLRIEKGATLAELSSVLKINSKVLQALEAGNVEQLPKPAFVRGFIKSYVLHLKADPDTFLKEYQMEMGLLVAPVPEDEPTTLALDPLAPVVDELPGRSRKVIFDPKEAPPVKTDLSSSAGNLKKEGPPSAPAQEGPSEKKDFSYSDFDAVEKQRDGWRVLVFSLVVVILSLVIYVAYRTIDRYQREARISEETERNLNQMAASAVQVPPASIPVPESALPAVVNNTAATTPNEVAAVSSVQNEPMTSISQPEPTQEASPNTLTANKTDKKPENTAETQADESTQKSEVAAVSTAPRRVREIVLEALGDVVINYEAGGKKGTVTLKKDQIYVLRFTKATTLKISDAGSVNVSVDGTDRGVPGEKGNSVVVQY